MKIKETNKNILIFSVLSVLITWFLNHKMGCGPIIANGLVGVVGALFLPRMLAGAVFTSSFVGMSGLNVIPTLFGTIIGGITVGIVIILTKEIYAGVGGKGGTTAATATLITKAILSLIK